MPKVAMDYTIDELMVATLARQLDDETQIVNGAVSFIPVAAIMLARLTHAPRLTWAAGAVGLDAMPEKLLFSTLEAPIWSNSCAYLPQFEAFWSYVMKGRFKTFCIRGAQIDQYGNVNNTVIGQYSKPEVRLPGSAGMGDIGSIDTNILLWSTTHNKRTFVEKVDFISCAGYLEGGKSREELGLKNGPQVVITDLAVLDFAEDSKKMRLRSVHPGVTVQKVVDNTSFGLIIPQKVPFTKPPTVEQVQLIRTKIDPDGLRKSEFRKQAS